MLFFVSTIAYGETVTLAPGESASVVCLAGDGECVALPGNPHAVMHSKLANENGYEPCAVCHQSGGDAVTAKQVMLCSQWDFRYPGIAMLDPATGLVLTDPVTGREIFTGGEVAGYDPGREVACRDCHYPHSTPGADVENRDIHAGCLDCHRRGGSGDRRRN